MIVVLIWRPGWQIASLFLASIAAIAFLARLVEERSAGTAFILRKGKSVLTACWPLIELIAVSVLLWTAVAAGPRLAAAKFLSLDHWPGEPTEQLNALEQQSFPAGGRRVVVERIISWVDLGYGRPGEASCEHLGEAGTRQIACYSDIELQVLRSRKVISHAPCGIEGPLSAPGWPFWLPAPVWAIGRAPFAVVTGVLRPFLPSCLPSTVDDGDLANPVHIPVVQSDFAAAFLMGRFGIGAGLLFACAQLLLLLVAAHAFTQILRGATSGNLYDRLVRRFLAVIIAGAALLFASQWLLSWSNALGLLPVMGQPMTWLSAATSHHLLMAIPCLLVLVLGLRYSGLTNPSMARRGPPPRKAMGLSWGSR
jgi:hypothetical protein